MSHKDHLDEYRKSTKTYLTYIDLAFTVDASGKSMFPSDYQEFCISAAFLGMFISWETFLERSFISYTLGMPSTVGTNVSKYVTPNDREHSNKILIGTQKYVDWSNPEIVIKLASLYLRNGEPFKSQLNSIRGALFDLKTIRNSCAHLSSSTSTQLDGVAGRLLNKPIQNCKVTDLIVAPDPNGQKGDTVLDTFLKYLDACAENIAKA